MNRSKLLSIIMFVLFIVSILLLYTCKKDPTSPNGNDPQTTITIGAEGGKLETGDFSLQVPAGSFSDNVTLNLSISTEESGFGASIVSESFAIKGIPEEFDKPLRLAIKYNGELSDSSNIAVGKMSYDYLSGDSSIVYQYISIKDSSGFLVGNLHGNPGEGANKIANITDYIVNPWTWIVAATGERGYSTDNFNIFYRGIVSSIKAQAFGNIMEEMRNNIINDLNYDYLLEETGICRYRENCWKWPIKVIITEIFDNSVKMLFDYRREKDGDRVVINVDENLLESPNSHETRENILKTLLTLSFRTYNDYFDNHGAQDWFKIAVIDWLSSTYNQDNPGIPTLFLGNELEPFDSMRESFYNDGHGRVTLIKYLIDNEKLVRNDLRNIINSVHENKTHPIYGILNTANGFVADWWPDFFEKLINNQIYNINSSVFLNTEKLSGTWNISNNDDNETILINYPDLSAKRFIVNLNNTNFDENVNLYLDATGNSGYDGVATIVFGVNSSNNLQHLVTAKNSPAMIPNLRQYYNNGTRKFLVVVVNSKHNGNDYWGNSDIELKMEVKVQTEPDYNKCEVRYKIKHNIYEVVNKWNGDQTIDNFQFYNEAAKFHFGTFDGTNFNGSYQRNDNTTASGTVTAELNSTYDLITLLSLTDNRVDVTGNTTYTTIRSLAVNNLPLTSDQYGVLTFRVEDSQLCNYITNSDYSQNESYYVSDNNWRSEDRTTTSYECDNECYLEIKFKKD